MREQARERTLVVQEKEYQRHVGEGRERAPAQKIERQKRVLQVRREREEPEGSSGHAAEQHAGGPALEPARQSGAVVMLDARRKNARDENVVTEMGLDVDDGKHPRKIPGSTIHEDPVTKHRRAHPERQERQQLGSRRSERAKGRDEKGHDQMKCSSSASDHPQGITTNPKIGGT